MGLDGQLSAKVAVVAVVPSIVIAIEASTKSLRINDLRGDVSNSTDSKQAKRWRQSNTLN